MLTATRCAVLGSPVAHSLSPVLHRAAYDVLGLDWSYDAVEVTEEGLGGFLDGLGPEWRGLSLTMPLKRAVLPLLDRLSPRAEQAGAANTVVLVDGGGAGAVGGGSSRREGHNTDVPGAVAALQESGGPVETARVLGGGATAASALLALADLGCTRATLVARSPARAEETLQAVRRHPRPPHVEVVTFDAAPVRDVDVLVSTIPAAAQDSRVLASGAAARTVFEVLYDPWPTPLAAAAVAGGQPLVGGLDLLVHQAALQVELMTGHTPAPVAEMRRAGQAALAARAGEGTAR